jgi:hypothetical protein
MIEIPNLDAMNEDELQIAKEAFSKLCQYATLKRQAILERRGAEIDTALSYEKDADFIYLEIPEEYRW